MGGLLGTGAKNATMDPIGWLKSKGADEEFIDNVQSALHGYFDGIELHEKLAIFISGYLRSINRHNQIIPADVETLCINYIKYTQHQSSSPEIKYPNSDHDDKSKNMILTVMGDFKRRIRNNHINGSIILNIMGTFSGWVTCENNGNIFIKCKKYKQSRYAYCVTQRCKKYSDSQQSRNMLIISDENVIFNQCWNSTESFSEYKNGWTFPSDIDKSDILRGNMYIKAGGNIIMNGGACLFSGSIYMVCDEVLVDTDYDTFSYLKENSIHAANGSEGDLIISQSKSNKIDNEQLICFPKPRI